MARPKFQVEEVKRNYEIYKASRMDSICHIKREYVNYYLFKGVENPILVTNNSTWIPHPFVALSEMRRFKILAESEDKYQILELGNSVGLMFDFNSENHNHRWLLRNYVTQVIEKIRSAGYRPKQLAQILQGDRKNFESVQDETIKTMYEEYVVRLKEEINKSKDLEGISKIPRELDVFKHSGMACRKNTLLRTVNQNSIIKAEEYPKNEMSGFHDPFLGDTERENRRWNNKQFTQKYARSLLQRNLGTSRHRSATRGISSSSATSSARFPQSRQVGRTADVSESKSRRAQESRSLSKGDQIKPETPADYSTVVGQTQADAQANTCLVRSYRESKLIERMYHQKGEDTVNTNRVTAIDDASSFARLRRYASKESLEEDDPSLLAAQSEATFSPLGLNRTIRAAVNQNKGVPGAKVLYRMRPNELNLVLPKVDTGVKIRSVSQERSASTTQPELVVNSLLMSKSKSKPLNALIKIVQVADPDDKTAFHSKRRKLRMSTEEERATRQNQTLKF